MPHSEAAASEETATQHDAHAADTDSIGSLTSAELLEAVGYRSDEFVSVCRQKPGDEFKTAVMSPGLAPRYAETLGDEFNIWHSANPTAGPARNDAGRGTAEQTTRLAVLFADLDVKPGACADMPTAEKIIDEVSVALGQRPVAVVYSGHGAQPYWTVEDGDISEAFTTDDAKSLLRRFGRLVAHAAKHQGGAVVDSVFDLARVLRTPETVNLKSDPVPVTARADVGGPLTVAEVDERLTELGIDPQADDATDSEPVSDPDGWKYAPKTCSYVAKLVDGIATDVPRGGRNPWACSKSVRLHCAWRLGCITAVDFDRALALLEAQLTRLLVSTEPRRALRKYEMRDIKKLGRKRAAAKTDDEARAELGGHVHTGPDDFWGTGEPNGNENDETRSGATYTEEPPEPPADSPNDPRSDDMRPFYAHKLLTRSDLRALPPPEPLIDYVLDRGTTALLYGKWGTAKTFIALDWAASVAMGRPWQGRSTTQAKVLYVVAEGAYGFNGRTEAWEVGWHTKISDDRLHILPVPVNLTDKIDRANLYALVSWGGYDFVVIDTMARCMVGADENSAKDCGVVIEAMTYLLASTPDGRGVVLGVHHAGKDGKTMRGSSAFESGVDTVYFTSRDGAVIELDRTKRKDGPENDNHLLKLDPIEGTGSAVISVRRGDGQTDRGKTLLSTFVRHFAGTGATKAELRNMADMAPATFHRVLSDLVKSGELINTGTDKRPFYVRPSE